MGRLELNPLWLVNRWMSDDWLVSRTAQRLFLISFVTVVAVTLLLFDLISSDMSLWLRILRALLGTAGPMGIFLLWYGMWRYWIRVDASGVHAKRRWFLALLFGLWYGACLYYLFVYRPQLTLTRRSAS